MNISYGILDYNPDSDPRALALLVDSMAALAASRSRRLDSEVFLLNQGNTDLAYCDRLSSLSREHGFHCLHLTSNLGISRGINLIAQLGRGDIISLVTSDVEVLPGTDEILLGEFERDPRLYQVTPLVNVSSIRYQTGEATPDGTVLKSIATELTAQFWRRDAFEEIGFFDERWKACYENLDWTMRLFLAGFDSGISRRCQCVHHHNTTTRNGSINQAYDNYLPMPKGLDHKVLRQMWNAKWPGLDWHFMFNPGRMNETIRAEMRSRYEELLYLPYVQDVGY